MIQVSEDELRTTHPAINGVPPLQSGQWGSLFTLFLHLPGDDSDVSHLLVLSWPVPQWRHVKERPRTLDVRVVAIMLVFLPERQVQSVVFVLQQLFHRKHGGSEHVHLEQTNTQRSYTIPPIFIVLFFHRKEGERLLCPVSDPSRHRQKAWPESAEWSWSPERTRCCSGRWDYWWPVGQSQAERGERDSTLPQKQVNISEKRQAAAFRTSMISVWACLVQKAWGGVVQLTATKLVGLRSRAGATSSLQAAEADAQTDITKRWELMVFNPTVSAR